ncbi:hypothetical protein RIF29_37188 [Crotalaria pallida]|uniref:Uncharacterized protein n=1 Tax=Crotalaria pallida TaxID=3830 RepID=A0AAN9EC94_CROPI
MGSNKPQTDGKLPEDPASKISYCQRNKSENGSFLSKLRNHFHEFTHASIDEHKSCFRDKMQKMLKAAKIFDKIGDKPNEGEIHVPLESSRN